MGGIFISYRREDSAGWTGRLAEQLKSRFGAQSIFMDIETIVPGADFSEALQKAVSSCDVLLAIIGPSWATAADRTGRLRLEDPNDWVRVEVAAALKRQIRVIPVLVGGASIPTMEILPDELDPLAHRQAHELTDTRWAYDLERLISAFPTSLQKPWLFSHPELWRSTPVTIGALAIAITLGVWIFTSVLTQAKDHHVPRIDRPGSTSPKQAAPPIDSSLSSTGLSDPGGREVRLKDHRTACIYRVLTVQTERSWQDTLSLRVTIRVTNEGRVATSFGDRNIRLLIDDVPRISTSHLHDAVGAHSTKDVTFNFVVPVTAIHLALQIRMGIDVAELSLDDTEQLIPSFDLSPAQLARLDTVKFPFALHAGQEVWLKDHRAACAYKVLAAQVTRSRPDTFSLSMTVRVTSEGPMTTNFGDGNFRLLVDNVPQAPTSPLQDSVDPRGAKERTIDFIVPATARRLVFQLQMEDDVATFPVDLSPLWL